MKKVSTKERILEAALTLFSEKGYDGVGVDMIAETIGVKGPSLYKHFKGKEDILNSLIEQVGAYYEANFGSERSPGKLPESAEEFVTYSMGRIRFTMNDPMIRKVRRLLMMEQFRNPQIAQLASLHELDGLERMFIPIINGMIESGLVKNEDPKMLALEYVTPVTVMIMVSDREPERMDEMTERIEAHFRHFVKMYFV